MVDIFEKRSKQSPIKIKPLREPGQSLREKREDLFDESVTMPGFYAAGITAMAIMGILGHWFKSFQSPWAFVSAAALAWLWAGFKMRKARSLSRDLRLGEDGERAVGQMLEDLRAKGYEPIHDVVEDEGNIDHVLVGPGGVFVLETKTVRKRKGKTKVVYDGCRVLVDGLEPERDPIAQAKACAASVKRLLKRKTGKEIAVRPVVIYPGWYVEMTDPRLEVWVMNDTYFHKRLADLPSVLPSEQVRLLAAQIKEYARRQNGSREG